jgi:EAL domain-containing protein (putative c-di-GMP-specific phosphodiesterase class I)/CheY-like chemotaxis protein
LFCTRIETELNDVGRFTAALPQRAFVVDDEAQAGAVVSKMLTSSGFEARAFTGPLPFLAEVKSQQPDMVVLDLALGRTDAVEVIRHLEVIKYKGRVLLISGRDAATLEEIRKVGLRHGLAMLPSLRKPFRLADLQNALAAAAETQHAEGGGQKKPAKAATDKIRIDLEQALRERWLELWYQPKIELKSLLICGAEGLLRARHPDYGIVEAERILPPPGDEIYHVLSKSVIRQSLSDWYRFADAQLPLKLAVNVPASVIEAPDFVGYVREMLPDDRRFPGLIFEITEDDVVRDPQRIHEIGTQLTLYGISLSIDDFGTAFSSLSRMLNFPAAEIKIDRGFVQGCADDERKRDVCEAVIELAHRFGMSVCAEGVEAMDDLRALMSLGCDVAQGFFFAKAMERDTFIERAAGKSVLRNNAQTAPARV